MTEIHNEIEELYAKAIINFIFEEKNMSIMRLYVFFGLEMIFINKNIKWRYVSGRRSEDKHSIKKDKQSITIFKSYKLRLPSSLFLL